MTAAPRGAARQRQGKVAACWRGNAFPGMTVTGALAIQPVTPSTLTSGPLSRLIFVNGSRNPAWILIPGEVRRFAVIAMQRFLVGTFGLRG